MLHKLSISYYVALQLFDHMLTVLLLLKKLATF